MVRCGNYHNGKFHINEVTGPDEYTCMVNNNYYTNVSAQYNLRWASKFYNMLEESGDIKELEQKINITEDEIEEFELAADNMYLPYDEELGINPQDDSFLQKSHGILKILQRINFHYYFITILYTYIGTRFVSRRIRYWPILYLKMRNL